MEGRNGFVNTVLKPMCERGGLAGDATTTYQRALGKVQAGSCGENWQWVHGLFIVEWTRSPKVRRQRLKSSERSLSVVENKEEKQCRRGKVAQPEDKVVWRKIGEVEEEFENGENRRKLDEQRMRLEKELREVEKLSFRPQEIQSGLKEGLQQQLQDIEQKMHDLLSQHQRVQKRSQKIQGIQPG